MGGGYQLDGTEFLLKSIAHPGNTCCDNEVQLISSWVRTDARHGQQVGAGR